MRDLTLFDTMLRQAYDAMSPNFVHQALIETHLQNQVPDFEKLSPRIPYVFHDQLVRVAAEFLTYSPRKRLKRIHYITCG